MMRLVRSESVAAGCWRPLERYVLASTEALENQYRGGHRDALLSYHDIGNHSCGEYSMASVQANYLAEDQSELKLFPLGTFIGVYDGHGGPEAAHFVKDHLFAHLAKFASEQGGISVDVLRKAFDATEKGFESVVSKAWKSKPLIAAVGSCCLAGVICNGTLYVANLGDSRAVMGTALQNGGVAPRQLTMEHNAGIEAVREQLRFLHPDDSNIVSQRHGVWRVKGIIQVSRSIGDLYLKKQEFNREPLFRHFRLSEPIRRPVLTAEPSITVHKLALRDQFLIFASDGLWEHLSNEEAVNIVHSHPHRGVARRLIKAALRVAARKREMRYSDLKRVEAGVRRHLHDDISVVVVFFNHASSNPK